MLPHSNHSINYNILKLELKLIDQLLILNKQHGLHKKTQLIEENDLFLIKSPIFYHNLNRKNLFHIIYK